MKEDSSRVRRPWLLPGLIVLVLAIGFAALPQGRASRWQADEGLVTH